MRKFLCKGTALVLALALVCGAAALAETMETAEEFCEMYNVFLPAYFKASNVDEASTNAMVALIGVSYNEERTQESGLPTYDSMAELVTISFMDEDDAFAGFTLRIRGDEDNEIKVPALAFVVYLSYRLDALDGDSAGELIARLLSENAGSGEFNGYDISFERTFDFMTITFERQ